MSDAFAQQVLAWFDENGRHDLPWQTDTNPYRVWVSEIMLQQTRVSAVIPYYERFMQRFVTLADLAEAPIDEVLHHWSGLGYYARARNLHKAAGIAVTEHGGDLPQDPEALEALPGIGRSTAAAILALAHGQRRAILDGNVKRVLARYHAVAGWPGKSAVASTLWAHAEEHTPTARVAAYTQAMMDLGATLCTRSKPACAACPVQADCQARREGRVAEFPASKPRRAIPVRATTMLLLLDADGRILLERRPPVGIWGGLWGFPEPAGDDPAQWVQASLGVPAWSCETWPVHRHTFSHFHLDITPVVASLALPSAPGSRSPTAADTVTPAPADGGLSRNADDSPSQAGVMEGPERVWYNTRAPQKLGLAAPVAALIARLAAGG